MTEEEIAELRIYHLNMQHFIPILEKRKKAAHHELIQKFNSGESVERAAAKLAALSEIETEAWSKIRKFESIK